MKEGVLHFKISGEFVTRISRNLWAEGASAKALRLLVVGLHGMTEEIAFKILKGDKKLVGWNSNIKLVPDKATKDSRGLPLPKSLAGVFAERDKAIEKERAYGQEMAKRAGDLTDRVERTILGSRFGVDMYDNLKEVVLPEEEEKPKPTKAWTDWTSGWLSLDGDFYGCEYTAHTRLAHKLGFDDGAPDKQGWIKYQRREWVYVGRNPITQKQIDALYDWSVAMKRPIPKYLMGEPGEQ